nr:reverse transcriptase domain-containing protein [Tanacetum cinerariifolium]
MSTRSSARNLFSPLDNLKLTIRKRSRADPTLLNDFEMAAEGPGDLPLPDLRTMKELCQPSLNGRGGPIAPIAIQAMNFGLKNDMIQQVQNSCQFHGLQPPLAKLKTYMLREPIKGNNQGRNQFFQGASHGQNPPPAYQALVYQAPMNTASSSGLRTLPSNTITNPKKDLKGITTRSGTAYQGHTIPTTFSFLPQVVERETEVTKDTVSHTNNGSTKDVQPLVVQIETHVPNSEPIVAPIIEPVAAPISAPKPNQKPSIPYPSKLHDQKLCDKANDQKEKFFQIFQDLNFNTSFADALILMLKFGPTIKTLLTNKDKLSELARTPLNDHCSAVLLKKLPEKLGDPVKFLIPCDFIGMDECLALADLDASINLIQL